MKVVIDENGLKLELSHDEIGELIDSILEFITDPDIQKIIDSVTESLESE